MSTDAETLELEITSQIQALQSPLAHVRAGAARRLGHLKTGSAALVAAMQDSHEAVRVSAARALATVSPVDETERALILDHLLSAIDDSSDRVCQAAVWALGMRQEKSAGEQISEMLSVSNPFIAGNAILALARIGERQITDQLIEYLAHPSDYVKTQAVRAVALLQYQPAAQAVLKLFYQVRSDREQRGVPRHALINHLFEAIAILQLQEAVPTLLEIAQKEVGLRGKAVETLIALRAEEAAGQLAGMLVDPSASLRKNLLVLMAESDFQAALPLIRPLLRDDQPVIRKTTLQTLGRLRDSASLPVIEWMCFHDPSPFTRLTALEVLRSLQGDACLPVLLALAEDPNTDIRRAVIAVLLEIDTWNDPELRAAARFTTDFPTDEVSVRLKTILSTHAPPAPAPFHEVTTAPDFPVEMAADLPLLLSLLEQWQHSLRSAHPYDGLEATRAALAHLIATLKQDS